MELLYQSRQSLTCGYDLAIFGWIPSPCEGSQNTGAREVIKKIRRGEMAGLFNGLKLIYSRSNFTIEWSCDNLEKRQVYASMLADF